MSPGARYVPRTWPTVLPDLNRPGTPGTSVSQGYHFPSGPSGWTPPSSSKTGKHTLSVPGAQSSSNWSASWCGWGSCWHADISPQGLPCPPLTCWPLGGEHLPFKCCLSLSLWSLCRYAEDMSRPTRQCGWEVWMFWLEAQAIGEGSDGSWWGPGTCRGRPGSPSRTQERGIRRG